MNEKVDILAVLLTNYDDGRRKSFYCLAVNLLKLSDLKEVMKDIDNSISKADIQLKGKIERIVSLLRTTAKENHIELELRK